MGFLSLCGGGLGPAVPVTQKGNDSANMRRLWAALCFNSVNFLPSPLVRSMVMPSNLQSPSTADLYLNLLKQAITASLYDESSWVLDNTTEHRTGSWRRRLAERFLLPDEVILQRRAHEPQSRAQGLDWPWFGYSMIGHLRLDNVRFCVESAVQRGVPGDVMECGAWRGGAAMFMRGILKAYGIADRQVWVADSFEGLPKPKDATDGWDLTDLDYLKVSLEQVQANFARFDLLDAQVRFLKGWFSDTLPTAPVDQLAVLRLDGDMYSSTTDTLRAMYPKVSQGGFVIVDDYHSWPACKQAVDDYLQEHGLTPDIQRIDWAGVFWQVE